MFNCCVCLGCIMDTLVVFLISVIGLVLTEGRGSAEWCLSFNLLHSLLFQSLQFRAISIPLPTQSIITTFLFSTATSIFVCLDS